MAADKAEINILYEDAEIIVIDKPAGWVTTNEKSKTQILNSKNIENWLKENKSSGLEREGIVHRLDKGTSGLLVVAKTKAALIDLKKQFKQRQVEKHYLALAGGDLPSDGQINMPIDRSKYSFGKFKVDEEGKRAVTEFKLLKKIIIAGKIFSLLDINLKTGRTHQIRVHLSYLGWPLAGDKLYGGLPVGELYRPFLHSQSLTLRHPKTKKLLNFISELAPELSKIIENVK